MQPLLFLMQKCYERITGNKLALPKYIWVDVLNEYIPLLKCPEVKLILNNCISKLTELQSVRNSIAQNPGKVVVLAKSATFAYLSSSVHMLNEWRGAMVTVGMRKNNLRKCF